MLGPYNYLSQCRQSIKQKKIVYKGPSAYLISSTIVHYTWKCVLSRKWNGKQTRSCIHSETEMNRRNVMRIKSSVSNKVFISMTYLIGSDMLMTWMVALCSPLSRSSGKGEEVLCRTRLITVDCLTLSALLTRQCATKHTSSSTIAAWTISSSLIFLGSLMPLKRTHKYL